MNHTKTAQEPLWAPGQVIDGAESRGIHHERMCGTAEQMKAAYQMEGEVKTNWRRASYAMDAARPHEVDVH